MPRSPATPMSAHAAPMSPAAASTFDRHLWLAVFLAFCVAAPRTLLVSRAHSEYWDDQGHLSLGLALLMRERVVSYRLDPPLGQVLTSLPMVAMGCLPPRAEHYQAPPHDPPGAAPPYRAPLYGQKFAPETLRTVLVAWKVLLFLPLAALVFHWCRLIYGIRGGWLALRRSLRSYSRTVRLEGPHAAQRA